MLTITAPGRIERCPCCGRETAVRLRTRSDVAEWNISAPVRWEALLKRIRLEARRRHGLRLPRCIGWVAHRQHRGADHLHYLVLAHDLVRLRVFVQLYREFHAEYGFGFMDDPEHRDEKGRQRVWENGSGAAAYLGGYLRSEQLGRRENAADRGWRSHWLSPAVRRQSTFTLERCLWLRQAYAIAHGRWTTGERRRWYLNAWAAADEVFPPWWYRDEDRAWVVEHLRPAWDGVPGSLATSTAALGEAEAA
jgi:hypothetical protein